MAISVYFYPTTLQFFADDSNSHRQIITIYNPLEFGVKFKVLTTAPKKYTIDEPEGFIKSKSHIELTIRHINLGFMNENVVDKLRIQVYQASGSSQFNLIYKKDLPLNSIVSRENFIISSNRSNVNNSHNSGAYDVDQSSDYGQYSSFAHGNSLNDMMSQSTNSLKHRHTDRKKHTSIENTIPNNPVESVNYLVIIIGLICLVFIFLPTVGTQDSNIPNYMHMTFEMKLFASFVLGMVTMVILK